MALDKVLLFLTTLNDCSQKEGIRGVYLKAGKPLGVTLFLGPGHRNCHFKPDNLMVLEVREEILRAQVNNKWCDAQRLAIGAVNEKTTYSKEKSREAKLHVNFAQFGEANSFIYISLLFQL